MAAASPQPRQVAESSFERMSLSGGSVVEQDERGIGRAWCAARGMMRSEEDRRTRRGRRYAEEGDT